MYNTVRIYIYTHIWIYLYILVFESFTLYKHTFLVHYTHYTHCTHIISYLQENVAVCFFSTISCALQASTYMHKQREFPFKRAASSLSNEISIYVLASTQNYNLVKPG